MKVTPMLISLNANYYQNEIWSKTSVLYIERDLAIFNS